MNPGDSIKDLKKPLSATEAKSLGLPDLTKKPEADAKVEKKDPKTSDKPAKDARPEKESKPAEKIDVKQEIPANGEKKKSIQWI